MVKTPIDVVADGVQPSEVLGHFTQAEADADAASHAPKILTGATRGARCDSVAHTPENLVDLTGIEPVTS